MSAAPHGKLKAYLLLTCLLLLSRSCETPAVKMSVSQERDEAAGHSKRLRLSESASAHSSGTREKDKDRGYTVPPADSGEE